jgi:predicted Zn-dependent protease
MKKITCIIFEQKNSRSQGELVFFQGFIEVRCDGKVHRLENSSIDLEIGGSNSQYIFIKSESLNIYFEARQLKGVKIANPRVAEVFTKFNSSVKKSYLFTSFIFIIVLSLLYTVFFSRGVIVDFLVQKIPYRIEQELGKKLFDLQKVQMKFIVNKSANNILEENIRGLRTNLPIEYQNFRVFISRDPSMNAFAFPGGNIVLNSGLILKADSFSEVLGVLAHEMSHVTRRHVIEGIIYNISLFSVVNLLVGDISGLIAVALENGGSILSLNFSKEMELEADRDGLILLEKSGVELNGLIRFLEKVKAEEDKILEEISVDGEFINKITPFFSTHPATQDRINYLKINTKDYLNNKINEEDFIKFRKLIKDSI